MKNHQFVPKSFLFVCLGNICRSPLAEGIARSVAQTYQLEIEVDSAGTSGWHIDEPPCEGSQKVALENSIDISMLKGRKVSVYGDERFDMIIALDSQNYADLKQLGFKQIYKLGDFGLGGANVPDPYLYRSMEGFRQVYAMIEKGVHCLLNRHYPIVPLVK